MSFILLAALFAAPTDYIELIVPAFASFGMPMLGSCDVSESRLSCALPHVESFWNTLGNGVSVSVSVKSLASPLVSVLPLQLKRMSIGAYEEQPKPMKHVCQSHLPEVYESTMALQDGRLTSVPSIITLLDPSLTS